MPVTLDALKPEEATKTVPNTKPEYMSVTIVDNGPYVVEGSVPLTEEVITPKEGHYEYRQTRSFPSQEKYALCRCGHSKTPPFCDGTHDHIDFDGAEVASRVPYEERADVFPGDDIYLLDDNRCAFARFCHRRDGEVWTLTEMSSDPRYKAEAIKASGDCPAGRLVHYNSEDQSAYEPELEPGISLLEDPEQGVSGPLRVRGGIALISADGTSYEQRNRYALCRCGDSRNKPFCDAMHASLDFVDGVDDV